MELNEGKRKQIDEIHASLFHNFKMTRTRGKEWRRQQLRQVWWMIEDNKDRICEVLYQDLHKHRQEAYSADVKAVQDEALHTYENLDRWTADEKPSPFSFLNFIGSGVVRKEPLGVTLIIGAWNYPFVLLLQPMIAAIAAGCSMLLKPSDVATASEKLIMEIIPKYMDRDAIQCITAGPVEMAYVLEKRFNHIFFTGSAGVAKIIAAAAAKHLTPITLELGGQGPAIVTKTADIDLAAKRIAATKILNAGQICLNVNHVLVDPEIRGKLVERLKHHFEFFFDGSKKVPEYYTTIINKRNFDRLEMLLAKTKGNVEYLGYRDSQTLEFGPTIVTGVTLEDSIMSEELFGPILPIIDADLDDAIAKTSRKYSSMEHPLAMYVFSSSKAEKEKILNNTLSGGVSFNDCIIHAATVDAPFGGVGNSGYGAYHGKYGVLAFSHLRTVLDPPTWLEYLFAARYPPYTLQKLAKLCPEGKPPFKRDVTGEKQHRSSISGWTVPAAGFALAASTLAYVYGM